MTSAHFTRDVTNFVGQAFESAINPTVTLDPMLLDLMPKLPYHRHKPPNFPGSPHYSEKANPLDNIDVLMLSNLMPMLSVFRQPDAVLDQIEDLYAETLSHLEILVPALTYLEELIIADDEKPCLARPSLNVRLLWSYRRMHGLLLFASLYLNQFLYAAYPERDSLLTESDTLTIDIMEHAQQCLQYRPLGAGHVPLCLAIALAANKDVPDMRSEIWAVIEDFQPGESRSGWSIYEESYVGKLAALRAKFRPEEKEKVLREWDECRVQ
jgi:hypothetical protein